MLRKRKSYCRSGAGSTFFTEFSLVAAHALALATDAVPMAIAIGHLALVVTQRTLLALPAGITDAFTIDVLAMLGAEDGADAFAAIITTESRIALAMTQQALSIARATVRAVLCHVLSNGRIECQLLHVTIVVVQRDEPVTRLHVASYLTRYGKLQPARKRASDGFESRCVLRACWMMDGCIDGWMDT